MTSRGRRRPQARGGPPDDDSDGGAALVEFVVLAVALMVPMAYVVLCAFDVQRAAFATSTAAREAARVFVLSPSTTEAQSRSLDSWALALGDQGVPLSASSVHIACEASPCLTPGAEVTVTVDTVVPLPFVPWVGRAPLASVPVHARSTQTVDLHAQAATS